MKSLCLCPGELLVDFICTDIGSSLVSGRTFLKKAGGAPANVTACIAKLGKQAAFAGSVGNDAFGEYLENTLNVEGVDTTLVQRSDSHNTTMAFVSLTSDGERDFNFLRGADIDFVYGKSEKEYLERANILHFGSATGFMGGELELSYLKMIIEAHEKGKFISFDPNYREALTGADKEKFVAKVHKVLPLCHIIKVSQEELQLLTNTRNIHDGINALLGLGAERIIVTLGSRGAIFCTKMFQIEVAAPRIKSIDSTGAGDAFVGGMLYRLSDFDDPRDCLDNKDKVIDILTFAATVGAKTCTKHGAIEALPTYQEVNELITTMKERT